MTLSMGKRFELTSVCVPPRTIDHHGCNPRGNRAALADLVPGLGILGLPFRAFEWVQLLAIRFDSWGVEFIFHHNSTSHIPLASRKAWTHFLPTTVIEITPIGDVVPAGLL